MTPPAPLQIRVRPTRSTPPPPADWRCDNCHLANAGRRRRCLECGTSRC